MKQLILPCNRIMWEEIRDGGRVDYRAATPYWNARLSKDYTKVLVVCGRFPRKDGSNVLEFGWEGSTLIWGCVPRHFGLRPIWFHLIKLGEIPIPSLNQPMLPVVDESFSPIR